MNIKETLRGYIAKKLGLISEEQCLALVKKNLQDFRIQANHVTDLMNRERQALFKENVELRGVVAELHGVMVSQGVRYPGIERGN